MAVETMLNTFIQYAFLVVIYNVLIFYWQASIFINLVTKRYINPIRKY